MSKLESGYAHVLTTDQIYEDFAGLSSERGPQVVSRIDVASHIHVTHTASAECRRASQETARLILVNGWLQVLAGCLACIVLNATLGEATPGVGAVHTIGCVQGALLVGASGSWHMMRLSPENHRLAAISLLLCVWPNFIGPFLAAALGASGNAYDRSFTCTMTSTDVLKNAIVSAFLQLSTAIIPAIFVIVFGAYASADGKHQKKVSLIVKCMAFGVFVLMVKVSILPALQYYDNPELSGLVDPNLLKPFNTTEIFTPNGKIRARICPDTIFKTLEPAGSKRFFDGMLNS
jgi:hypothetical protein